eukprot:CAMPEP_0202342874 /NCGR_PEP_ID=MMETSP1126-20121109/3250_1 /ASSEMBLY_ACC=CAM_ASM_000457 /TAXON_ID=3047 /ORGANISM="Dunaliella tertiolecta, Strain CCMP1320" /LENGTH=355 /DNA_ID=CAMNT_0048933889 /DNA_START=76 /DNA_END=1143 /DNA_ORIENTATION=-
MVKGKGVEHDGKQSEGAEQDKGKEHSKAKEHSSIAACGSDVFRLLQLFKVSSEAQLRDKADARVKAKEDVLRAVHDPNVPGVEKQRLRCDYVHSYGRALFSCPGCWLLPGLCVCGLLHRIEHQTKVIVSCHPAEWCKSSNTGTAAALSTGGSVLLRGYGEHDAQLEAAFADPSTTKAILWPGETAILPQELKAIADRQTQGRVTLIAIDAHWNGARHLVGTFPPDMLRVKLPPESVLTEGPRSLLSPLRCYRGDVGSNGRVSTLEAIAALLYELEGDRAKYDLMLENLKIKVDAVLIQKSRPPLYNTIGAQQGTKVRHEAQLLARKHVEELTRQGKSVEDLGRGLMKYLKEANDD